jgi:hypothetical protein
MEVETDLSEVPEEEAEALAVEKDTSSISEEIETGGPHEPWQLAGRVVIEGEDVYPELLYNGYFPGEPPAPPLAAGHPYYVLALKVDGTWTVTAPTAELLHPTTHEWPYGNYTSEYEEEGCEESGWISPTYIAGWPSHLKHGRFSISPVPYHAKCTPWYTFEGKRIYNPPKEWWGGQSFWWRTPTEMPVKFPNPSRKCSGECPVIAVPSLPSIKHWEKPEQRSSQAQAAMTTSPSKNGSKRCRCRAKPRNPASQRSKKSRMGMSRKPKSDADTNRT